MDRSYICIDLKSFYASVECAERNLDSLTTNLIVADISRTEKTICLAVSPSLKTHGIPGRARLFEVIQKIKIINNERKIKAPRHKFVGESTNQQELKNHPELSVGYIIAPPQMAKYIEYSTKIYEIYLKFFSAEDIHVYSIDEVFIDATDYLKALSLTAYELTTRIIREVFDKTKITATAGIGTNLYLAKIAMDIVAKHIEPNAEGARIAALDEREYRQQLWTHEPLTDFWRIGRGYLTKLNDLGLYTMGDIARCSIGGFNDYYNEDLLYKVFGINAELLIDHAWGRETTTMSDIKAYKPISSSISTGQVLHCGYGYEKTKLIIKEMIDLLALDLVDKQLVTNQLVLSIGYDIDNLNDKIIMDKYQGEMSTDYYGRAVPKGAHGSINIEKYTSSSTILTRKIIELYDKIIDPILFVKRVHITVNHIIHEDKILQEKTIMQLNLFSDLEDKQKENKELILKEKKAQKAILDIKKKYGKNAVLKGMNLEDGATTKERNKQIGGHKA